MFRLLFLMFVRIRLICALIKITYLLTYLLTYYGRYSVHQYAAVLPAAVAGVGLHVDTTAYVF